MSFFHNHHESIPEKKLTGYAQKTCLTLHMTAMKLFFPITGNIFLLSSKFPSLHLVSSVYQPLILCEQETVSLANRK